MRKRLPFPTRKKRSREKKWRRTTARSRPLREYRGRRERQGSAQAVGLNRHRGGFDIIHTRPDEVNAIMSRRIFLQVTAPAVLIGLLLCGTCLACAWYISRLQATTARIVSENVASLQAAQELEMHVRQLRYHCFVYLLDPQPHRLAPIETDEQNFEKALGVARRLAGTAAEKECVATIATGYQQYQAELARLREEVARDHRPLELGQLADNHPARHVAASCQELLRLNKESMEATSRDSERVGRLVYLLMLVVGVAGPLGGLLSGLGIARGLSRSICQLSVRVRGIAQRLDQDVASVNLVADGDLHNLDRELQHVVLRVEEVAERLQRQQRDLLRAEQLAAVGQLAASVAHEVRNPLTAVKMLVEVALRPNQPKPLTDDDLHVMHREIARLEKTVQNFLDFARLPTPRRSDCDLRDVVARAVDLVQARARFQHVEVAVDSPPAPVTASVDRDQLHTVLVNLFLNALDAMPQGGTLGVTVGRQEGTATVQVCDTGPGIAPEMMDRLFTPFASSKPTGTGLGLSLSRRIVEEHGGSLEASNRAEGGARFTIVLSQTVIGEQRLTAQTANP
jgi:two-component system, NtrC family, sensor histidine kinase HydH